MKGLVFLLFSAVLVLQSTDAFPRLRVRRDAQTELHLTAKADKKRTELQEYMIEELATLAKDSIATHKKLFEKVLKQADEAELKSDDLKKELAKFSEMISKIDALPELDTEEAVEKLFELFGESMELGQKYDDIENPNETEKLVKRLVEENGGSLVIMEFLVDFIKLRANYRSHIQEYFDSLSDQDMERDSKFFVWFQKFKTVTDFDKSVDLTMEVFQFFFDDDE